MKLYHSNLLKMTKENLKCVYVVTILVITFSCLKDISGQVTYLDKYIQEYRLLRNTLFKLIGRTDGEWSYKWNLKRGKVQKTFPESQQFFCNPNGPGKRSESIPNSVHQLRPGDIDIIGALGDSLTAGNGGLATNFLQVFIENKGVSASIGGQATWRKYLTLPNMLKVFNPNLYGYSLSDGFSVDKTSKFNVGEPGAMSRDIPHQARNLVKRMISDPLVHIKEHWKLVTILIGPNDFCSEICVATYPEQLVEFHEKDLVIALRTLKHNLPRTMVNLVTPPSMKMLVELRGKPSECEITHTAECSCFIGSLHKNKLQLYLDIIERWKEVVTKVSNMEEFNEEDFTVNNQPFLYNALFPKLPNGNSDFTYLSSDCFHLSQKGYARASNALWNNMMEPEGHKTTNWKPEFAEIICPTDERPYIATKKNSYGNKM